jgi:hypothetical protein
MRHGAVPLRRDAGTSILIVLVLAAGIGGNAQFSLFSKQLCWIRFSTRIRIGSRATRLDPAVALRCE